MGINTRDIAQEPKNFFRSQQTHSSQQTPERKAAQAQASPLSVSELLVNGMGNNAGETPYGIHAVQPAHRRIACRCQSKTASRARTKCFARQPNGSPKPAQRSWQRSSS